MPMQEPTKPFNFILSQLDSGAIHDELSEMLRALNLKLRDHAQNNGKAKGKLTLTLDLTVEKGVLMIGADIQAKAPKDDAIKEACVQAEKDTGLPLFYGAPEA